MAKEGNGIRLVVFVLLYVHCVSKHQARIKFIKHLFVFRGNAVVNNFSSDSPAGHKMSLFHC